MKRKVPGFGLIGAAAILIPAVLSAQAPPPQHAYAHYASARISLRTAQMLMKVPERPNVQLTLKPADDELGGAIQAIDRIIGHPDNPDRPLIDAARAGLMDPVDRFRSIVELLRSAQAEVEQEPDASGAGESRGSVLKHVVLKHIEEARHAVRRAAIDARLDQEIGDF